MRTAEDGNGKESVLWKRRKARRIRWVAVFLVGCLLGAGVVHSISRTGDPPDRAPPAILAVEPLEGTYLPAGVTTFRITFSEPLARSPAVTLVGTSSLPLDEAWTDRVTWRGEVTIPEGADGTYVLRIADVVDPAGNGLPTLQLRYEVDATPPTSRVSIATNVTSAPFDLTWDASDGDGSGVAWVELWLRADDGVAGPWTLMRVSEDAHGVYRFDPGIRTAQFDAYALAVDRAGNREDAPTGPEVTIVYDPTPPTATILPADRYWIRNNITLQVATGPDTDRVDLLYFVASDGATWTGPHLAGTVAAPYRFTFEPGGAGYYRLAARAHGTDGHAEPLPTIDDTELSLAVDPVPPIASLDPPRTYWNRGPLVLTANATDDASGVTSVSLVYAYRANDTQTWSPLTTFAVRHDAPWSWTFPFPEGEGLYAFAVRPKDVAGNMRDVADPEVTVGYDPAPPSAALLPVTGYWFRGPVDLTAIDGGNVTSVELDYYFAPDNATWHGPFRFGTAVPPFAWTFDFPVGPGHYRLYAQAQDALGQREADQDVAASELALGFDAEPPSAGLAPVAGYWHDAPLAVVAEASDDGSGVAAVDLFYAYRPTAGAQWSDWTLAESRSPAPWAFVFDFPLGDGNYVLAVRARDGAGNEEALPPAGAPDVAVGYNRDPPRAPHVFLPRFVDPVTKRTNLTWTGSAPDVDRFEIHRGATAEFVPDTRPCGDSSTCLAVVSGDARTTWAALATENETSYFRVRAIDEGGLDNTSTTVAAVHHGLGFDTPDGAAMAGPLPVEIAWSERLRYDGGCVDCTDAFVVALRRFDHLRLDLAVPPTGDFALLVYDTGLESVWSSDVGGFGGWESLTIEVLMAGTYYVVVDWRLHAGPDGRNEGWYTLAATVTRP